MNIAIDALGIHYYGGGRTATLGLLEALFALDSRNEYLIVLSQPEPSLNTKAGNVRQWIAPTKNRLSMRLWSQLVFPYHLKKFDIVHFIKNLGVFGLKSKTAVTIYDLTTLVFPELFPVIDVLYWRTLQKWMLRQVDSVIAISENTSQDIQKFYNIPPNKIRVIYPAYNPNFNIPTQAQVQRVRKKYNLPPKFIVHVGRIDRKKNLGLLIRAFSQLRSKGYFDVFLVFVGEEYQKSQDPQIYQLIDELGLKPYIIFTGVVPENDIAGILGAAIVSVFCSLHEGFGIVALETMACGTPLVVTPAGAILEAVGDAAKVVPLGQPDILANTLHEIIISSEIQDDMVKRGLQQITKFSWTETARKTLDLYEELRS